MEADNEPYRFKVSLGFKHPTADLSFLSQVLALEPLRTWRVGESRTTPKGTPLDGVWRDSYWIAQLPTEQSLCVEESLLSLAGQLKPHAQLFRDLIDSGGAVYLSIGLFLNSISGGFLLEQEVLTEYANIGIALDFDIYGPDNTGHAP